MALRVSIYSLTATADQKLLMSKFFQMKLEGWVHGGLISGGDVCRLACWCGGDMPIAPAMGALAKIY